METLLCVNLHVLQRFVWSSTWILSTHFFEIWSQRENIRKRRLCVLVWTANLHTLRIDDTIAPPLDLWTLQNLITTTTTTTMADYMLVSLSGLPGQNILLLCCYAERKRIMDDQLAISIFFLLCSVSSSSICLYSALCSCSVSSSTFLLNFKHHL